MEISDNYDVADVNSPTKTISDRGDGVLWFIDLPATGDEWYAVEIPFSALKIHESWEGANAIPFNATKMAKLQFKVQGPQDASGYIGVDNIYFPGVSEYKFTDGSPVLKPASQIARTSGLKVNYLNGKVNVNWNGANLLKAKLAINSQGAVFASSPPNAAPQRHSPSKLAAGMYFVKFNATMLMQGH